jgi:hypothetical protein
MLCRKIAAVGLPLLLLLSSHTPTTAQTTKVVLRGCEVLVRSLTARRARGHLAKSPGAVMCWGFMAALQDLAHIRNQDTKTIPRFCLPDSITPTQLARIFISYAKEHPEQLDERPSYLVLTSWSEAYPCGAEQER